MKQDKQTNGKLLGGILILIGLISLLPQNKFTLSVFIIVGGILLMVFNPNIKFNDKLKV